MPNKRLVFIITVMMVLFAWVWPAWAEDEENPALILEVMELVREYHLSNPQPGTLTDGAIRGMLDELGDPYTEYFDPDTLKSFTDALNGDLTGIGVELIVHDGIPVVVGVIPGTPAERGGLQANDLILAVDGSSTAERPLNEVAMAIRGPLDTQVVLTVARGDEVFDITMQRADVHVPTIDYEMMAGKTGYLAVYSFGSQTTNEFESAIRELQAQGMQRLIVDLRDNGGGYLDQAVDMADNFLPHNALVVSTVDNQGYTGEIRTGNPPAVTGLPIIVLTNLGSASASEILAGALRDHGLASLVGDVTYGKGVVQTVIPLSTGGALKLTVARYLTPAGTEIDITGLGPDDLVITPAVQQQVAWLLLNPDSKPELSFSPGGEAMLNDREIDLVIDVLEKDGREYLPLRTVLECMLYQVFMDGDNIRIFEGDAEKMVFTATGDGQYKESDVIVKDEVHYLAVDLCRQLNINITKDDNGYTLERRI